MLYRLSAILLTVLLLLPSSAWADTSPEPKVPMNIPDTPRLPFPSDVRPIQEVIRTGVEVPLQISVENPSYRRPVYLKEWHSTYGGGRLSDCVERLREALHRLHTSYMTGSIWYDFTHGLGISNELTKTETASRSVFDELGVVIFQAKVHSIHALGNQVVIVAAPQRTGLTLLTLPLPKLPAKTWNAKEALLIQLVTPDGYEYDFNVQENMKGFDPSKQKPDL